jgi:hypothetical protein
MACLIDVKHHNSFPTLENATGADSRSQFRIAFIRSRAALDR